MHKVLAQDMLVVVIAIVFSIIAPIVLFPCAIYCLCSRIVWTHQLLYVYEPCYESGGQFWPLIFRRFIFGLLIAQATIVGQFFAKEAFAEGYLCIFLMFLTYQYLRSMRRKFDKNNSCELPLELATIMDVGGVAEVELEKERNGQHDNCEDYYDDESYLQPCLRAVEFAKPEQPFPQTQLSDNIISSSNDDKSWRERVAFTKANCGSVQEREQCDKWWEARLRESKGKRIRKENISPDVFYSPGGFWNVLVGFSSGNLRSTSAYKNDDEMC
jgi:hypothetical protein